MDIDTTHAHELRKLIYTATTAQTPNFGGHHGIYGFEAGVGAELLRTVDTFIGQLKAGKATKEQLEQVRAQCNMGRTVNILSDTSMKTVDNYLDEIKEKM